MFASYTVHHGSSGATGSYFNIHVGDVLDANIVPAGNEMVIGSNWVWSSGLSGPSGGSASYNWINISGASGDLYTVPAKLLGAYVNLKVNYSNGMTGATASYINPLSVGGPILA